MDPVLECTYFFEPMHFASRAGSLTIIRHIHARAPASVNAASRKDLQTPLHIACFHGYTDTVELLLSLGANCNAKVRSRWMRVDRPSYQIYHRACFSLSLSLFLSSNAQSIYLYIYIRVYVYIYSYHSSNLSLPIYIYVHI